MKFATARLIRKVGVTNSDEIEISKELSFFHKIKSIICDEEIREHRS